MTTDSSNGGTQSNPELDALLARIDALNKANAEKGNQDLTLEQACAEIEAECARNANSPATAPTPTSNIQGIANELEKAGDDGCIAIEPGVEYPKPKFSLFQGNVGILPIGDIAAVKAKSKNGKSFLCSILAASMLGCRDFGFDARPLEKTPLVIYFDTEQNVNNTVCIFNRVRKLLGWDNDKDNHGFYMYNMRKMNIGMRYLRILQEVKDKKPKAVFIDGIADLIGDFNNIEDSGKIINALMQLSAEEECVIVNVLHTNKAKDDNNMKGHLGTMLVQKASDVFEVVRDKASGIFNVTQTESRNLPINDFAFSLDCDGIPHSSATAKGMEEQEKFLELVEMMKEAFGDDVILKHKDLSTKIREGEGVCSKTANTKIKNALTMGIISKERGLYKLTIK